MVRGWVIGLALLGGALDAHAQTPTATITGTVADASGAAIPGATVSVHNQNTGVATTAVSNERGLYVIPYLEPGRYRVDAELSGFKRYVRSDLVLELGRVLSVDIRLEIGTLEETVTVTPETPLLKTETSSIHWSAAGEPPGRRPEPANRQSDVQRRERERRRYRQLRTRRRPQSAAAVGLGRQQSPGSHAVHWGYPAQSAGRSDPGNADRIERLPCRIRALDRRRHQHDHQIRHQCLSERVVRIPSQ
jgi:hypothetical protein